MSIVLEQVTVPETGYFEIEVKRGVEIVNKVTNRSLRALKRWQASCHRINRAKQFPNNSFPLTCRLPH